MKVLIADDEAASRISLRANLQKWDYEVRAVEDGDTAWHAIETARPDIAILDWIMPGINGIDLCRMIRSENELPYIYIVMVTGKTEETDVVSGLEAGADDYIVKPCSRDILRSRLAVGARIVQYERTLAQRNALLQNYSQKMEKLAEERSRQLVHTERIATVGILSAGIAHEINNPMTFISGNLQMLERMWRDIQPVVEQAEECSREANERLAFARKQFPAIIEDMRMGVKRVTNIVKGLKAFCRKDEKELAPCDLNACIEQSLELCYNALKYHVKVIKDLDEDLREVLADSRQMSQVLINLITNAADAVKEKGRGEVIIRTRNADDDVVISVADNGPGIPKEKLNDIWQPFYTTKPVDQGTGLGLSITSGIIEEHNGRILAGNQPDGGAMFTITLPALTQGVPT